MEGVGLKLDGYPSDEKRFYWIVAQESCHPKAAKRILDRIRLNGYDLLTVMSYLKFDWIISELGKIGVTVTYIKPLEGWLDKYNDGTWPDESLPDRFKRNK